MSLLLPLGLLGLLGLLVLFIIYIIKPNYQQKLLSSTFVWKLSLKYQKKRLPVSKLRNLLLLLCQILILVLMAFIFTQPAVVGEGFLRDNEKVIVIDASASMLATTRYDNGKYTRFEEAVDGVIELAEKTFKNDGTLTIIIAGAQPQYLSDKYSGTYSGAVADEATDEDAEVKTDKPFYRVGKESESEVVAKLNELKTARDGSNNPRFCTYGSADIEGAMSMAEDITSLNPKAEVLLYTGKKYLNSNGVTVMDMSRGAEEVNVAVLDVRAVMEEGYYTFYADVVSYGENSEVDVRWHVDVDVYSSNGAEYVDPVTEIMHKSLKANEVTTVIFDTNSKNKADGSPRPPTDYVYEFASVTASVVVKGDAIEEDNYVTLYGGVKPTLKVQYASPRPNIFFSAALMSIGNALRNRWDIDIDEVRGTNTNPKLSGYDFYIFEHTMPTEMPKDGVVFLVNPSALPNELGVMLGRTYTDTRTQIPLYAPEIHPLTQYMDVSRVLLTSYTPINTYPDGYTVVMQCAGKPVFISKNTANEKIAVMTFSLNYSDMPVKTEFITLIYNMFEYYIPSTFTEFVFDVNDSISLNARGASLMLDGNGVKDEIKTFPAEYRLTQIGTYTVTQTIFGGGTVNESFFVKMPAEESNICLVVDLMPGSVVKAIPDTKFDDLLVWFAAALVAILLIEWWLQSRSRV